MNTISRTQRMADSPAPQSANANIYTALGRWLIHTRIPVLQLLIKADQGTETENHPAALSNTPRRLNNISYFTIRGGLVDLRSRGHKFDSWLGCYQVVTTWMGECLTCKSSLHITNHQRQLSLPSLRGR